MKTAQAVSIRWLPRSRPLIFIAINNWVACKTKPPFSGSKAPQVLQQCLDAPEPAGVFGNFDLKLAANATLGSHTMRQPQ